MIPLSAPDRKHYKRCAFLSWPTRPELLAVLLLNIVWRLGVYLSVIEGGRDSARARERRAESVRALTKLLDLARRAFYGMTNAQYMDWVRVLREEERRLSDSTRTQVPDQPCPDSPLSSPLSDSDLGALGPEARRLLARLAESE